MVPKRRALTRPLGNRRYKKLFVIAAEGVKTEPQYFRIFDDKQSVVQVKCLKGDHGSSPPQVLRRMNKYLGQERLTDTDEAWLVVDKDQWTDDQLDLLHQWSNQDARYGLAISNPNFEFWLLLHFEDGVGVMNAQCCKDRLTRHLPNYNKGIDVHKFTQDLINVAIQRAKLRYNNSGDLPGSPGTTTVYKLIEQIINS